LIWIWDHDHASAPEKIDARYITRTWARATPIGGNSGFERFEIADRTPQDTESGRSTAVVNGVGNATEQLPAWDDPADLWAGKSEPVDLPQVLSRKSLNGSHEIAAGALASSLEPLQRAS